ncbi:MAG: HAMP domain-containing sensor histidine kinase [Rhizomicrobium sp.]
MAQGRTFTGPVDALAGPVQTSARAGTRHIRVVVIISLLLIAGSFASAGAIQMRLDRMHAMTQAAAFGDRRAQEIATDLSAILEHYQALGTAFANAEPSAETSAALSEAGGRGLRNIAVLDGAGRLQFEMTGSPEGLLPLPADALASTARAVIPSADGRTMALAFRAGEHIVAMQIDPSALLPPASMEDSLVATSNGKVVALGVDWNDVPAMAPLALDTAPSAARIVDLPGGARLISLRRVPGWPLSVGSSVTVGDALGAWYGALPLYLFFIFGPALAGAGLAVVFVREFERRARTAEAMRTLRATAPEDARLLVRLADAERRAIEAERSKTEFIAHMSHELRTPLNAIIGFSEVIEQGFFGQPGHPKYVEYAHDIAHAGRQLHDKIGDILEFADLEARRHLLAPAMIDVAGVVRAVIDENAVKARARKIKLTVSLPGEAHAFADAAGVKRILSNIVANALQYTPAGGSVRVQLRSEQRTVVIAVRDSGLGFSLEESAKAGEAFTRFDRPGSTTGTGLGLATSMMLARRMGGVVRISGAPGDGTLAELHLPKEKTISQR